MVLMKDSNLVDGISMPLGLGMALAQNGKAMDYFASLSDGKQQQIIAHTHQIVSKQEMRQYVDQMMNGLI
ncbi:MAG: hypothetical protein RR977_03485 [Oscillospiraceae bacterium]